MTKRTFYLLMPCAALGAYVLSYLACVRNGKVDQLFLKRDPFLDEFPARAVRSLYYPLSEMELRLVSRPRTKKYIYGHWTNEDAFVEISSDGAYSLSVLEVEREGQLSFDDEVGFVESFDRDGIPHSVVIWTSLFDSTVLDVTIYQTLDSGSTQKTRAEFPTKRVEPDRGGEGD